ncbi:hypothetical protein HN953_00155 [Candidatus Woesearchaeota archaeon]|nr:hypothetical protein [Candidatus Woesearchaeota archaeon]
MEKGDSDSVGQSIKNIGRWSPSINRKEKKEVKYIEELEEDIKTHYPEMNQDIKKAQEQVVILFEDVYIKNFSRYFGQFKKKLKQDSVKDEFSEIMTKIRGLNAALQHLIHVLDIKEFMEDRETIHKKLAGMYIVDNKNKIMDAINSFIDKKNKEIKSAVTSDYYQYKLKIIEEDQKTVMKKLVLRNLHAAKSQKLLLSVGLFKEGDSEPSTHFAEFAISIIPYVRLSENKEGFVVYFGYFNSKPVLEGLKDWKRKYDPIEAVKHEKEYYEDIGSILEAFDKFLSGIDLLSHLKKVKIEDELLYYKEKISESCGGSKIIAEEGFNKFVNSFDDAEISFVESHAYRGDNFQHINRNGRKPHGGYNSKQGLILQSEISKRMIGLGEWFVGKFPVAIKSVTCGPRYDFLPYNFLTAMSGICKKEHKIHKCLDIQIYNFPGFFSLNQIKSLLKLSILNCSEGDDPNLHIFIKPTDLNHLLSVLESIIKEQVLKKDYSFAYLFLFPTKLLKDEELRKKFGSYAKTYGSRYGYSFYRKINGDTESLFIY